MFFEARPALAVAVRQVRWVTKRQPKSKTFRRSVEFDEPIAAHRSAAIVHSGGYRQGRIKERCRDVVARGRGRRRPNAEDVADRGLRCLSCAKRPSATSTPPCRCRAGVREGVVDCSVLGARYTMSCCAISGSPRLGRAGEIDHAGADPYCRARGRRTVARRRTFS